MSTTDTGRRDPNSAPIKAGSSGIEWTTRTWNPVTGCDKISPGCKFCYAEALAKRLQAMGNPRYKNGFGLTMHADKLTEPTRWLTPGEWVFVNSMSDLLHADIPEGFIMGAMDTMGRRANWLRYQVLTKRAERWPEISAAAVARFGAWPRNVLPGVSVENRRHGLPRIDLLGQVGDADTCRMLSVEPLLESLLDPGLTRDDGVLGLAETLTRNRIGWVITGGEAGYRARGAELDWFREVRDACQLAGVPFFHKQHGGQAVTKEGKRGGLLALLDGRLHHEMPVVWHADLPSRGRRATMAQPGLFG